MSIGCFSENRTVRRYFAPEFLFELLKLQHFTFIDCRYKLFCIHSSSYPRSIASKKDNVCFVRSGVLNSIICVFLFTPQKFTIFSKEAKVILAARHRKILVGKYTLTKPSYFPSFLSCNVQITFIIRFKRNALYTLSI